MRVALICQDKPDALQMRKDNRAAHLAYIEDTGVVEMAGPFLTPEGEMSGSLVVLIVDTLAPRRRIGRRPIPMPRQGCLHRFRSPNGKRWSADGLLAVQI